MPSPARGETAPSNASQTAELRRALKGRLTSLQTELDELAGRYLDAEGGPPEFEPVRSSATAGVGGSVAQELLKELQTYPEWAKAQLDRRTVRTDRADVQGANLRRLASEMIEATKNIQHWFTSPHSADIPTALDGALQAGIRVLGIPRRGFITVGDADQLDTFVDDARRDIFQDGGVQLDVHHERPDPPAPVAVFRSPFHEAAAPRYWPILLGHELAHLKLITDSEAGPSDVSMPPVEGVEFPPESQIYLLLRLGILDRLDLAELRRVIEDEESTEQRISPPPPGIGNPERRPREPAPASPIAARIQVANDWVEEVVCDLAMVRRFGPAAVAAMSNYLTSVGGYVSLSQSHPPGYFRARMMLDYLGQVPAEFDHILNPWRTDEGGSVAPENLPEPPPWAAAMINYINDNRETIYGFVDGLPGEKWDLALSSRLTSIQLALRQLRFGLPPFHAPAAAFTDEPFPPLSTVATSTTGATPSDDPAKAPAAVDAAVFLDDVDVINAGWMAVVERDIDPTTLSPKVPVDRLLLKSIETLQLLDAHPELRVPQPVSESGAPPTTTVIPGALLGGQEIRRRQDSNRHWRRIIVTPRIEEPHPGASIDLRLGNRFIVFQRTGISTFNARRGNNPRAVQRFIERPFSSPFVLHPGEVVLASALEYIALPIDIGAQVITRSSYGRLGLITATAVQVHPLYRGCLTLELVNLGTVPLTLYAGERVAQLVFFNVQVADPERTLTGDDLFQGTYSCPTAPEFPNVKVDQWMVENPQL